MVSHRIAGEWRVFNDVGFRWIETERFHLPSYQANAVTLSGIMRQIKLIHRRVLCAATAVARPRAGLFIDGINPIDVLFRKIGL